MHCNLSINVSRHFVPMLRKFDCGDILQTPTFKRELLEAVDRDMFIGILNIIYKEPKKQKLLTIERSWFHTCNTTAIKHN